jgi:hypothetical protein
VCVRPAAAVVVVGVYVVCILYQQQCRQLLSILGYAHDVRIIIIIMIILG